MNWKIITGILLILAGARMFFRFSENTDGMTFNPIYVQAGLLIIVALGIYLMVRGFRDRNRK